MTEPEGPVSAFEKSRLELARTKLAIPEELVPSLERACATSARALGIDRVGVWILDRTATALYCIAQLDRRVEGFTRGQVVQLATSPRYLAAIESRRVVAAPDARHDPRTAELTESYLAPMGITSMLDAPIFHEGEVYGIVCHEQIGSPRTFDERDLDFASSVADVIGVLFEQAGRLAAEDELRRGERLRAMGRLAASVAHDFNGVLGVLALKATTPEAISAIEIGRRLVGKLLVFGEHVPMPAEVLDLAAVLEGMGPFFHALEAEIKVALHTGPLAKPARVRIARSEIEQIVLNLVFNARDASPPKSLVTITVESDDVEARVVVRDQGAGMTPEVKARIFEPFFTTKEPGRGSGMGLATVYGLVTSAGGSVGVDSDVGRGSTFTVRLPRVAS